MEQKESNFKTILSVVFSCTRNVGLGVLALYLVYFLGSVISSNWNNIWPNIVDFSQLVSQFVVPVIDFIAAHIFIFFSADFILFLWLLCIIVKLEDKHIQPSFFVYVLLFTLILFFGILLMIYAANILTGMFAALAGILSCVMLAFFGCGIITCIVDDDLNANKTTSSTDISPKQLDLFDDQK